MINSQEIQTRSEQIIEYSDKLYPILEQSINGERRSRQILRLGMQAIALTSTNSSIEVAGESVIKLLHDSLIDGGMTLDDTAAWPNYNAYIVTLPEYTLDPSQWNHDLDEFSMLYADTERRTIALDGSFETDATHVVHLAAIAIPYALQHHPRLNPGRLAVDFFIHDAPEAYAGDTATLGASVEDLKAKDRREDRAVQRIEEKYSAPFPNLVKTIKSYQTLEGIESRYVKTFDKIDPKLTLGYSEGICLRRDYKYTREQYEELSAIQRNKLRESYGKEFDDLVLMHDHVTIYQTKQIPWQENTRPN